VGEIVAMRRRTSVSTPRPHILERFGVAPVAGEDGVAQVSITGPARNPWGIMHGSLFALLAEQALLSRAPHRGEGNSGDATRRVIHDLMLRFVAPARSGPARAVATQIAGDLWRVVIRDVGSAERVCGTVLARIS